LEVPPPPSSPLSYIKPPSLGISLLYPGGLFRSCFTSGPPYQSAFLSVFLPPFVSLIDSDQGLLVLFLPHVSYGVLCPWQGLSAPCPTSGRLSAGRCGNLPSASQTLIGAEALLRVCLGQDNYPLFFCRLCCPKALVCQAFTGRKPVLLLLRFRLSRRS